MRNWRMGVALAGLLAAPAFAEVDAHADAAKAYKIETSQAPLKVKKGEKGKAKVEVVPRSDAHVSPDAPLSVTVSAGPALDLPKPKLGRTDAKPTGAKGVEFEVPFVGKQPGKDELKAQVTFFICTEKLCERQKREVALAVVVE
ncbi:MAG TPA: hypothetical protein VKB92_05860 [Myxococcales bacterium]|nr:hypothetical protein [Myxococcales bacterium]